MKCQYKIRWVSSKGALLVLIWTLLYDFVIIFFNYSSSFAIKGNNDPSVVTEWLYLIPLPFVLLSTPLFGWLADAKFGYYKVFRVGISLVFMSTMLNCLSLTIQAFVWENNQAVRWIQYGIIYSVFVVGGSACFVTLMPLGLDQMPDASAFNISSYISWNAFIFCIGIFLNDTLHFIKDHCLDVMIQQDFFLILAFISTFCASTILICTFLLQPKWFIDVSKSSKSLQTIYQVLKFASKHKAPLCRSVLTYWEENIPSRIDLGKSKYGGPFTTEQVEDVKTVLRLLALSVPLSFAMVIISSNIHYSNISFLGSTSCTANIIRLFTTRSSWYSVLGIVVYEFVVYPIFGTKFPSILKRIGAVISIMTLLNFVCLVFELVHYFSPANKTVTDKIVFFLYPCTAGVLGPVLVTSAVEFICAQSPYHIRGLLVSYFAVIVSVTYLLSWNVGYTFFHKYCTQQWCSLLSFSLKTVFCVLGLFLFGVFSHWYKLRVRDEDYSAQRVIEEVYDRYLTAAAAHSHHHH